MKKIMILSIILIIITSGVGATNYSDDKIDIYEKKETMNFSMPNIYNLKEFLEINLKEATSYKMEPGYSIIPAVTKVYHLPFGSNIENVEVQFSNPLKQKLVKKIKIASEPLSDDYNQLSKSSMEIQKIYQTGLYPIESYSYNIGAGRYKDEMVCYLTIKMYPIKYDISNDLIYYSEKADIKIDYTLPKEKFSVEKHYDLLIITPTRFSFAVQQLVQHKQSHNISTKHVTLRQIYSSKYFPVEGRDCAEEIKYFIKNAFDEWGIKYVLLVGGRNGGIMSEKWHIPIRYSNLNDGEEATYLTDLYFADIYDSQGHFSSWDSNENDIFAEWYGPNIDILDMYPEVYVGRIPCRSTLELKTAIRKIVKYENEAYGKEWFKRFVGVAGDTYASPTDPYFEGELATQGSFNYIESLGFESSFIWTSNGRFTGKEDVIDEISLGCGFLHFSGHGSAHVWSNHPPHEEEEWIDGPSSFDMALLRNKEKQPITIVGGCHNAQYNVSLLNILKGIIEDGEAYFSTEPPYGEYWKFEWVPRCWAWSMANKIGGGCIAIIANTGLGYGASGENWNHSRGRVMEMNFFKSYSNGFEVLGETHGMDLVYYLNEFPPMSNQKDCKIVQQWALLGDPSLMIGGYPN